MRQMAEFDKRRQLLIRTHNEALSVAAMRVNHKDRSPVGIYRRDTAQLQPALLEILQFCEEIINNNRKLDNRARFPATSVPMKNLSLLGLVTLALLIAPAVSFAQSGWTSPCSSGATIDETALGLYAVNPFPNNACLTYRAASTGTIAARYDVTNTAVPSTPVPPWAIFEFGYVDTGLGSATAILYEINPCVPNPVVICRIVSVDNQFCGQCTFSNNTFNFLTNLYFVEVTLNRPAGAPAPQACTLRIF